MSGPSVQCQGCARACGEEEERGLFSSSISPVSLVSSNKGTVAFHAALDLGARSKILPAGPWAPFPPLSSCSDDANTAGGTNGEQH